MRPGRRSLVLALALLLCPVTARAGTYSITAPDSTKLTHRRDTEYWRTARDVDSFGILQSASLIGYDHEHLLSSRIGAQFGVGLIGADVGLTYHFSPGIRNNHLYLGYWNLGLTEASFVGGAAVLTYVMRTRGLFTLQLGLAAPVVKGNVSRDFNETALFTITSIGLCLR